VRKIQVIMAEKSLAYDQNPVVPFGVSEEYRKKSPLGKIPCFEDGDFVLPDSSCIAAYLERTHPTPALLPSDAREYARALWYEEYGDTKLADVCGAVFFQRVIRKLFLKQDADEERVQQVIREEQPPVFDYLDGELADREFLVGNRFSLADIAIASPFVNLEHGGGSLDASRWRNLASHLERIHSRPSFKACIEREKAFFATAGG
jgi:glutathione S-transferase